MPKIIDGDINFSENEASAGSCPICQNYEIKYGCSEIIDTGIVYPFTCNSCGTVGKQYDKTVFDGYLISYVPEDYDVPNLVLMKRIAVIENGYIRDAQIFTANPAVIETYPDWECNFRDVKNPCQYIGVIEGMNEDEIRSKAAQSEGVHPDVITLIDINGTGR